MSFHWTLTAAFLYALMGIIGVIMLPIVPPSLWNKLFKSNLIRSFTVHSYFLFNMFMGLLVVVFLDSIRDTYNRSEAYKTLKDHPDNLRPETEALLQMRMFRAQRNFHISGFALFSWFVFKMLLNLISQNAQLKASQEASLKQAKSATEVAQKLLKGDDDSSSKKEIDTLEKKLQSTQQELDRAKKDVETMKKQSEQLTKEYKRLVDDNEQLEEKLRVSVGNDPANKKDD
ncbi:B-cell receptor-associated protein 29 [Cichlidogyrus casuarinus]|uniref:Endoplasmic reticulum transmembrane protein n=1 Tax=Cichlidogyrus casuarinus TaxID=1844966 RepID=A0ABD2PMA2_9PLAT